MVSTRRSSRAEQVASNAWNGANGGFIFADAPNAVTSAAVIIHQISMHLNITPLRVTRLSRVSSRASGGFTTIAQRNSSPARRCPLLTRIRWINRRPDQPDGCLQTGKRCFTNRGGSFETRRGVRVGFRHKLSISADLSLPFCMTEFHSLGQFRPISTDDPDFLFHPNIKY
jgi:hypothetical protein